jgi:hypothetical protein
MELSIQLNGNYYSMNRIVRNIFELYCKENSDQITAWSFKSMLHSYLQYLYFLYKIQYFSNKIAEKYCIPNDIIMKIICYHDG